MLNVVSAKINIEVIEANEPDKPTNKNVPNNIILPFDYGFLFTILFCVTFYREPSSF